MTNPTIIPGTFKADKDVSTLEWREELKGTVEVEFEGSVYVCPALYVGGLNIIRAEGFKASTKTGKYDYDLGVSYRVDSQEHNCQIGGNIKSFSKVWRA